MPTGKWSLARKDGIPAKRRAFGKDAASTEDQ